MVARQIPDFNSCEISFLVEHPTSNAKEKRTIEALLIVCL
jgi:hypothetical protein